MSSRSLGGALVLLVVACAVGPTSAQVPPTPPRGERPTVTAVRLAPNERIQIDGTLDEPAWARAGVVSSFTQSDPQNGAPATERTEIRLLFDEDRLLIGAEFSDSDPGGMLGNQMVRVRRHDRGWTAEIEIPFRTLNFDPRQDAWGAMWTSSRSTMRGSR